MLFRSAAMTAAMLSKPAFQSASREEIMESAKSYLFGAANIPEKLTNSKPQQLELTKDPTYEPDAADLANAEEEEIAADMEDQIDENLSNQVIILCIPIHTYMCSIQKFIKY